MKKITKIITISTITITIGLGIGLAIGLTGNSTPKQPRHRETTFDNSWELKIEDYDVIVYFDEDNTDYKLEEEGIEGFEEYWVYKTMRYETSYAYETSYSFIIDIDYRQVETYEDGSLRDTTTGNDIIEIDIEENWTGQKQIEPKVFGTKIKQYEEDFFNPAGFRYDTYVNLSYKGASLIDETHLMEYL